MELPLVRIFTIVLQILAGLLAVRLIGITRKKVVWIFISGAIFLTVLERSLTYYQLVYDNNLRIFPIASEYIAFYIAVLTTLGIGGLHTLFGEINKSHNLVKKSERKYRTLLENLPQCIYMKDSNLFYASCNDNFAKAVGMAPAEVEGRTDFDLYEPERAREIQASDRNVIEAGEIEDCEVETERDGKRVFLHMIKTPVSEQEGGEKGVLGIYWDITEHKLAEIEHRALEAKMRQAQKLEGLGVLAGGIAHDFNNLLTGILGNTYLTLMELPDDSDLRSGIGEIEAAANRAADLTSQMLAYSGQGQYILKQINLADEISGFEDLMRASISKKAILELDLKDEQLAVMGDPFQLRQIVMNLATNASEAIGDANGIIKISAAKRGYKQPQLLKSIVNADALEAGDYACIDVSDTGCGFDEQEGFRLFEPFFSTKFTGRGLGLAAVLGIVRAQKGGIFVSSEPGHGSRFTIILPLADGLGAERSEEGGGEDIVPEMSGGGTVLVVDDERVVREVARRLIKFAGFEVITASNGPEGLEIFEMKKDEIDCVLLDMTMPMMSGREVFDKLVKIDSDARIIISSGYNESEVTPQFKNERFVGFVQKPYNYPKLYQAIWSAMTGREQL